MMGMKKIDVAAIKAARRGYGITSVGCSARFRQRLAVDPRLALQIVDRDVGVVPSKPRPDAEAPSQVLDTIFGEPSLGQGAGVPKVDATGAGIAVEVVFSDQALRGEAAVDGRCRGSTLHRLLLGAFRS